MRLLDWGDGLGKKSPCPPDHPTPGGGGVTRQNQGKQRSLVEAGEVQCLQTQRHGPASQCMCRPQIRPGAPLQVFSQRCLIASRQPIWFTSHDACQTHKAFICSSCASCISLARVARTRTDSADSFLRKAVKEMKSVFVGELISE